MKGYVWLFALCYVVITILPLPLLPNEVPVLGAPVTSPTQTDKPAEENITVLDTAAGVLYTFRERDFLIYTVAAEMPASYHPEALKAQAVATYTYYMREKNVNADKTDLQGADTAQVPLSFPTAYSPEGLQEKWGNDYEKHLTAVASAVDAVFGQILTYDGEAILAVYHARNGGRTETAGVVWGKDYPYLPSVVSSADAEKGSERVTVSDGDLAAAFEEVTLTGDAASWIGGNPTTTQAGTVTAITIGGTVFTGSEVRERLNLKSACFTVTHGEEGFVFEVKGHGHAVGMSQVGAGGMAAQGFTYEEILAHYYPGASLVDKKTS